MGRCIQSLQKRGGNLAIPVPKGIGSCGYINNLTKNELIEIIDEYKNIVKKYPRNGLGVEPLCQDAGLEDPLSIFKIEKPDLDEVKLN